MIDRLTPARRHLALLALAAVLGVTAEHQALLELPTWATAPAGALLTAGIAWATTLTRQYGTGAPADPAAAGDPDLGG